MKTKTLKLATALVWALPGLTMAGSTNNWSQAISWQKQIFDGSRLKGGKQPVQEPKRIDFSNFKPSQITADRYFGTITLYGDMKTTEAAIRWDQPSRSRNENQIYVKFPKEKERLMTTGEMRTLLPSPAEVFGD